MQKQRKEKNAMNEKIYYSAEDIAKIVKMNGVKVK